MKRSPTPLAVTAALLTLIAVAGCGEKKTDSGLSPEAKKRFGYTGMPMPPEAQAAINKSANSGPPAGATVSPAPAAPAPAASPAAAPAVPPATR